MSVGRLFNEEWYLRNNPDVREAVEQGLIDAWTHHHLYGRTEGRSPDPLFNPAQYLAANPDVQAAVEAGQITAYDHFLQFGASEGRSPVKLFDPEFYLSQNPDVRAAVEAGLISATEHLLLFGQNEPRQINPFIHLGDYLSANADLEQAAADGTLSPLVHLLMYGVAEGRDLGNGINLAIFANDPDFAQAVQSGNFTAAMDRVGEVAPFLPSFEPPPGWEPAPDTPIPTDFTPPEGTQLVIPPNVVVPDGMELPDTFEPVGPEPAPSPDPGPGPRPSPKPAPDPHPQPAEPPAVVAAAGKTKGADGAFQAGDTVVVAFNQPVNLSDDPFTADSAALLGAGYEITRADIHWKDDSQVPDGPIVQYRIILGAEPTLADASALTLKAGAVTDAAGRATSSAISFDVKGDGRLVFDQPIDYPGWFQLAPDVDYELGGFVQLAHLADLMQVPADLEPLLMQVRGGEGDDRFFATDVNALMSTEQRSLGLDGGGGQDILIAQLDRAADSDYAPEIRQIPTFQLTATADAGLDFTHITGVESVWNYSTEHDLTLLNVGKEIHLGAYGAGRPKPGSSSEESGVAYRLQYGAEVDMDDDSQAVSLRDSHLSLLSVTWAAGDPSSGEQPFTLEIDLWGENQIDSFTDPNWSDSQLANIVKVIELDRMEPQNDDEPVATVLALGEVWKDMAIDMSDLKGDGLATLDLSSATITGELVIRIAELDAAGGGSVTSENQEPDQVVKLPEPNKLGTNLLGNTSSAEITLMNFTLASTADYKQAPQLNDVLDLSAWDVNVDELADFVSLITITRADKQGEDEPDLLNFSIEFFPRIDALSFTLNFENLITVDEYSRMLQALDTVEQHSLGDTRGLVGWSGVWKTDGDIFKEHSLGEKESVSILRDTDPSCPTTGDDAIFGLIGIFVNEGSWMLDA